MGGPGSGDWYRWDKLHVVESHFKLDIRHRSIPYSRGAWAEIFWTRKDGREGRQTITLSFTRCHYGGYRSWWCCPSCDRRCAILYFTGQGYRCRQCLDLRYQSQRQSRDSRLMSKAQRIRMRLGGSGNLTLPFPPKPKRMHWRTYQRLQWISDTANYQSLVLMAQRFGLQ